MKKIYLVGKDNAGYRNPNLVKILLENGYQVFYDSFTLNMSKIKKIRILYKIFKMLDALISLPFKAYMILKSDLVIVLALGNLRYIELMLAIFFKKKIMTDFYISFYDSFIFDRELLKKRSFKAFKIKTIEKLLLKKSKIIYFLNYSEAKWYAELLKVDLEKINYKIIPLCIEERNNIVKKKKINNDIFNICWWGSYIPLHGLEKILETAKILKNQNFKFKIYLFGNSEEKAKQHIKKIKKYDILKEVEIRNDLTFINGLGEFLENNCDLVLGNFGESKKAKTVIVNKLLDGIALKKPVLTGYSSGVQEYFDGGNDIWFTRNNPQEMAKKIKEIKSSDEKELENRINKSYKIYIENFSVKSFKKEVLNSIDFILCGEEKNGNQN